MLAQLAPAQWMEISNASPPSEEVHAASSKPPGTRAREEEPHASGFDETVDLVQQLGQTLDLVHDDETVPRPQLLPQAPWPLTQGEKDGAVQEVVEACVRKRALDKKGLSRLARTQEEMRLSIEPTLDVGRTRDDRGCWE